MIPLPAGTTCLRDDTAYAAIAVLNLRMVDGASGRGLAEADVLVVNVNGEMFTLPVAEVVFPGLSLKP